VNRSGGGDAHNHVHPGRVGVFRNSHGLQFDRHARRPLAILCRPPKAVITEHISQESRSAECRRDRKSSVREGML